MPSAPTGPTVVAFGGNALLPDPFQPEDQEPRAAELANALSLFNPEERGLVLVHGNGPQVGVILLRVEASRDKLPRETLDVLVAETQGSVGFLLTRALRNALTDRGSPVEVAAVLTQVVVDPDDERFGRPSKPIGPHYPAEIASSLRNERGWAMVESEKEGWRRVVASPLPVEIVELDSIREAARPGRIVVAGGGGGVPVRRDARGHLHGVEAVLDKDRTASLLAQELRADRFVVLTGVPHVSRDFGQRTEERIAQLDVGTAQALLERGTFPRGSMGPKVEAATHYVLATGSPAWITDVEHLSQALEGTAGTRIVP